VKAPKINSMTKTPNKLQHESSPYLLQHAYNPVDWHPWNDETLELARRSNRMMLVSIGYSACHWCHVMEHESFEDVGVAEIMNKHFVCIKVDREERPDVDHFFMEAIQLMGGRGGWPLNCFALPDGRPVWGGTYFRKEQWKSILQQIASLWDAQSDDLYGQADQLVEAMKNNQKALTQTTGLDNLSLLKAMVEKNKTSFDPRYGGNLGAPKFPMPDSLRFHFLMGIKQSDGDLLNHVEISLDKMATSGLYDQIGGGFARYAVDERWHIPHFEKMLYDNAQLIGLYADAYRHYQKPLFEEIVRDSISFLLNDMIGPEGAFYSALDADSEGVEGKYYVWTKAEFQEVLGEDEAIIGEYFGLGKQALWEDGLNVLVVPEEKAAFCKRHQMELAVFENKLKTAKEKLRNHRAKRIAPGLDDKRLLSWNALQISALLTAYEVFGEESWLKQAQRTVAFIIREMRQQDGGLNRSWKNGKVKIPAFLDDYSLMINALVHLYQNDANESHLILAKEWAGYVIQNFYNSEVKLFDFTPKDQSDLAVRPREVYDNVIPSSNAAMCMALVKLGILFEDASFLKMAEEMIHLLKDTMLKHPSGFSHWAQAFMLLEQQALVILRGPGALEANKKLRSKVPVHMLTAASEIDSAIPSVSDKPLTNRLQFWYCDRMGCQRPVEHLDELISGMQSS
jgi:uncharacterized protein